MQVAALLAVLGQARKLQLLDCLEEAGDDQQAVSIPAGLLLQASMHASDALRLDALQLACISPKSTALPGESCSMSAPSPCSGASTCCCMPIATMQQRASSMCAHRAGSRLHRFAS